MMKVQSFVILFIVIHIIVPLQIFDEAIHHDNFAYWSGYKVIKETNSITSSYEFFGRFPEILLPVIYWIISVTFGNISLHSIIIVHVTLFSVLYPIAIITFSRYLRKENLLSVKTTPYFICTALAVCPFGLPLQLTRQTLAFCICVIFLSKILLWKRVFLSFITKSILFATTHIFSISNILVFSKPFKQRLIQLFIITAILSILYSTFISNLIISRLLQVQWGLTDEPILSRYYLIILFILFIYLTFFVATNRLTWGFLIFFVSFLIISVFSIFIFKRLFYGMEFFFPIALLFIHLNQFEVKQEQPRFHRKINITNANMQIAFVISSGLFFSKIVYAILQLFEI